jgi:hypothetical protein
MKHRFQFLHRRAVKGKRVIDSKHFTNEKIILVGILNEKETVSAFI